MSPVKVPIGSTSAVTPLKTLLQLMLLVVLADGLAKFDGTCPEPQAMENFELKPLMGLWYEHSAYRDVEFKCAVCTFSLDGDDRFKMVTEAVRDRKNVTKSNDFRFEGDQSVAKFNFTHSDSSESWRIRILYTDYNSTCIFWSCIDGYDRTANWQILFILTRDRIASAALESSNSKRVQQLGLDTDQLVKTDQQDCPAPSATEKHR